MFRLALIVNPFAGAGGPAARKGSDAQSTRQDLIAGTIQQTAPTRARLFLSALSELLPQSAMQVLTVAGDMGESLVAETNLSMVLLAHRPNLPSTREDTMHAAHAAQRAQADLLVFVGGDGTARDICAAVGTTIPCLGVPAGVKMQSAVHAISPQAAARVVSHLVKGELVNIAEREVRDLDEEAYVKGRVVSKFHGELKVPDEPQYVQHVKQGGVEVEDLVLVDIAEHLRETLEDETMLVVGPGRTMFELCEHLQLPSTLLGVDVFQQGKLLKADVTADELESLLAVHNGPTKLWLTVIGGQGHIIGRGNQQLSLATLKRLSKDDIVVIASRSKLKTLSGRPLLVDSGDPSYDQSWQGYVSVVTGYHDLVMYPVNHTRLGADAQSLPDDASS